MSNCISLGFEERLWSGLSLSPTLRSVAFSVGLALIVPPSSCSVDSVPLDGGDIFSLCCIWEACCGVASETRLCLLLLVPASLDLSSRVEGCPTFVGRKPRWACNRCELIGRKKACEANEGTCVRLVRLVALGDLLEFVTEPPGPPKAPPVLHEAIVVGVPIPFRVGGARIEGRVCDDMVEPGRFETMEAAVFGLPLMAWPSF